MWVDEIEGITNQSKLILVGCDVWWDRDGGVGNRMGHGGANEESRGSERVQQELADVVGIERRVEESDFDKLT